MLEQRTRNQNRSPILGPLALCMYPPDTFPKYSSPPLCLVPAPNLGRHPMLDKEPWHCQKSSPKLRQRTPTQLQVTGTRRSERKQKPRGKNTYPTKTNLEIITQNYSHTKAQRPILKDKNIVNSSQVNTTRDMLLYYSKP